MHTPPHGGLLKISEVWVSRGQISKGCGGEKGNIFPEGTRALSEGNLPVSQKF